jgi:hypothetical protein
MDFKAIFQSFSRRDDSTTSPKPLTASFRNRVIMRCRDAFGLAGYLDALWLQIHSKLAYLHGSPRLTSSEDVRTHADDILLFLYECSDNHFLDFIELVFRTEACFHLPHSDQLIEDFNEFLRVDDLPYALTRFVWTKGKRVEFGAERETTTLTGYPQVIRRDSQVLHETAVAPVLYLLPDQGFDAANKEYLEALADYRRGDHADCLTKCGSAFESVMKVVCHRQSWPYKDTDTASALLRTVIQRSTLDSFFEQPLMLIATIRNRLSTSHGSGTQPREVPPSVAEYALNATAAAILLIVRQAS